MTNLKRLMNNNLKTPEYLTGHGGSEPYTHKYTRWGTQGCTASPS